MASVTSIVGVTSIALLARPFAILLVALVIGGAGFAIVVPAANLALVRGVVVRQSFVFGIKQSAGPMATFVSGLAVPVLALQLGWRPTFALTAAIPVVALFLIYTTRPPPRHPTTPTRHAHSSDRRLPVGRLRPLLSLTAAGFLGSSVVAALSVFLVLAAVDAGIGEGAAGTLLAAGSLTGITSRIGLGWLVDRHTLRPLRTVVGLLSAGAVSIGAFATGEPVAIVPATLIGFATAWGWLGLYQYAVVSSYPHAPPRPAASPLPG